MPLNCNLLNGRLRRFMLNIVNISINIPDLSVFAFQAEVMTLGKDLFVVFHTVKGHCIWINNT